MGRWFTGKRQWPRRVERSRRLPGSGVAATVVAAFGAERVVRPGRTRRGGDRSERRRVLLGASQLRVKKVSKEEDKKEKGLYAWKVLGFKCFAVSTFVERNLLLILALLSLLIPAHSN